MGNYFEGIQQHIREEFARLQKLYKGSSVRPYLVIDQLLEFNMSRPEQLARHAVHFTHIATLFVLDGSLTGRFTLANLLEFSELCRDLERDHFHGESFEEQFKAYCTLRLWNTVSCPGGTVRFSKWFGKMFSSNTLSSRHAYLRNKDTKEKMIRDDALRSMYRLLAINDACGMEYTEFFNLMQRAGEEKNSSWLKDRKLDWTLPLSVVVQTASDFIVGFIAIMLELGFEPWQDPSPSDSMLSAQTSGSSSSISTPPV